MIFASKVDPLGALRTSVHRTSCISYNLILEHTNTQRALEAVCAVQLAMTSLERDVRE